MCEVLTKTRNLPVVTEAVTHARCNLSGIDTLKEERKDAGNRNICRLLLPGLCGPV